MGCAAIMADRFRPMEGPKKEEDHFVRSFIFYLTHLPEAHLWWLRVPSLGWQWRVHPRGSQEVTRARDQYGRSRISGRWKARPRFHHTKSDYTTWRGWVLTNDATTAPTLNFPIYVLYCWLMRLGIDDSWRKGFKIPRGRSLLEIRSSIIQSLFL